MEEEESGTVVSGYVLGKGCNQCLINWGNYEQDSNIQFRNKLLKLQKCFVRIICKANCIAHAAPLFYKLNALKIDDLYKQATHFFL